jgi:hypothetical protein
VKQGGQSDRTVSVWQARNLQYDSNRTVHHQIHLTTTPNSEQPRLPPLILARQPASHQWTSAIAIYTVPPPAIVTDELTPSK